MEKNLVKLSYLAQKVLQRGRVPVLQLVDLPSMLTQNNGRKMPIFVTLCILPSHTGFKNIFIVQCNSHRRNQLYVVNSVIVPCLSTIQIFNGCVDQIIPYARHYNPRFVLFLPHFSFSLRFILQTIYVLKTKILHFLSLKSAVYIRERFLIKSGL